MHTIQIGPTLNEETELRWSRRVGPSRKTNMIAIRAMSAMPTMPMLLANLSMMSRFCRPVSVGMSMTDTTAMGMPTASVATVRLTPTLSWNEEMTTSTMEIIEVRPARMRQMKNTTPQIAPPGICEISAGKAMNASPGPPLTSSHPAPAAEETRKPRVANTPMPARTSNAELEKPTTRPELVRLDLRLTYEE